MLFDPLVGLHGQAVVFDVGLRELIWLVYKLHVSQFGLQVDFIV